MIGKAHVSRPGDGESYFVVGDRYRIVTGSEQTAGKYAVLEAIVPPGAGPPLHVHSREHEGFFVLEGTMVFYADGKRIEAGPGTALNLPPGVKHRFENVSDSPVRMLIHVAPGGFDDFIREVGDKVESASVTPRAPTGDSLVRLVEVAREYGIEILPER